jgi:hypothetical protein
MGGPWFKASLNKSFETPSENKLKEKGLETWLKW